MERIVHKGKMWKGLCMRENVGKVYDNENGGRIKHVGNMVKKIVQSWAAVVHLNFRAGSTFPVPGCTVPSSMDRTSRCNKVDAVRLYASYRLNLLLLKGQSCVCSTRKRKLINEF